jgi:response regulator RpfG family c-di-GMP phosphodiesterase
MKNPKILLIDDSSSVLELYKESLRLLNAEMHTANDGREGFAKALINDYDLIITDVDMPRMNGINLCHSLRAEPSTSAIPIIIVSTFDSETDIERGFEAGASAYLSKKEVRPLLKKTVSETLWKSRQVRQRKIMIVDDSRTIINLVQKGLILRGFKTSTALSGKIALQLLASEVPDLILSDIDMPELNGFELCKKVKTDAKLASIPFVVMSTSNDKVHMDRMMQYGTAAYIVKPFNIDQLAIVIEKILSDHFLLLLKERERLDFERSSLLNSIASLISALEARDAYTLGHSEAVSTISSEMVALSGAAKTDIENVAIGGRLHDIGKIGVPDSVLLKPGKLTEKEFDHIKKHPDIGRKILQSIPSLKEILPIVHSHHERWDGKGYPQGLQKTQIPVWARITAVVDTYHALTSDRPYRAGMDYAQAFEIIGAARETQLCPESVDLFFYWITSKGERDELIID